MSRAFGLLAAAVVAGCSGSAIVKREPLQISDVSPSRAPARGGTTVRVTGAGFGEAPRVWVRDVQVTATPLGDGALELVLPPLAIGPAALRLEVEGAELRVDDALVIEPLALAFADAAPWLLPALAPLAALAAFDADADGAPELAAAAADGLHVVAWTAAGLLGSARISLNPAPEPETAPLAEPAVLALDVDASTGVLAACVEDPERPIRIVAPRATGAAVRDAAVEQPVPCHGISFVRVDALGARWLLARTATGLAAWRPDADRFVPVVPAAFSLPGPLTAVVAADLDADGAEELVVAGDRWVRALALTTTAEGGLAVRVDDPFPALETAVRALLAFDADADGDLDLLAAGDGRDALFLSDGHGRYFDDAWRRLPFERAAGRAAAVSDLDLDGFPDLVIATADGPDRLFSGAPEGFLDRTPALGLEGPFGARAVVLLDVDRDGDRDVVTVGAAGALRVRFLVEAGAGP